jgi:hypothetical protein
VKYAGCPVEMFCVDCFNCEEKSIFFLRDVLYLARFFEDEEWLCRLANLTDIFQKLNELNLALQGFRNHIFSV